ncbi:methyl-accepting chemotaxis protein [Paenibacillus kobensis]|uniref:methyl-accepting chemotaxis protein n=1 Tax=Paenibacillus kobensis TaxID=59841 RepID=UPI000FDC5004|nr:HAMP domain-containing methyl-accepting chemotaxis protein [Paenibacillus kobensis]
MKWRKLSLVWKFALLVSVIIIAIVTVLVTDSMSRQRSAYYDNLKMTGNMLAMQVSADQAEIMLATDVMKREEAWAENPAFVTLGKRLTSMTNNPAYGNAYLLLPESTRAEADGLTSMMILTSSNTGSESMKPGAFYTMSEAFKSGLDAAMSNGAALTDSYNDDLGDWVTYLSPIIDQDGRKIALLGIDVRNSVLKKDLNKSTQHELLIAIATELASIALVVLVLLRMLSPLKRLTKLAQKAAEGDLTVAMDVKGGGEVGQLAESFNGMIVSLNGLTKHAQSLSVNVNEHAEHVHLNAEESLTQTQAVAAAVREVAAGSAQQLQSSQESQRAMTEMAIGIQRIAESSSYVSEVAVDTSEHAGAGGELIKETVQQMKTIEEDMNRTTESMRELQQESGRIQEAMILISDVASQTHLLALNASIEAARAGEHGRGFAVVATEIRKLAERSSESSQQVSEMLGGIVDRTNETAASVERSLQETITGSQVAIQAGEAFRSITEGIRTLVGQIQEVSASAEQMSAGSEQIAASLDELERIAEQAAGHASSAAEAADRQLTLMNEVTTVSESVKGSAEELSSAFRAFKV